MPAGGGKMKGTGSGDGGRRSRGLGRSSSNNFLDCSWSAGGRRGFPSVGGDVMRRAETQQEKESDLKYGFIF
ncbi:hypothetical protein CesoFtcFv8_026070 [Champsocephalus esox]|uniref:Uncharacterized protein n=1 Tax=Champsocephalus esox TaxID=159716 RepID=A0AAN8B1K9_9TELE|nr:hypothetical protein CesoFtcFv8_026070 [Champsocephalus esox]